MYFSFFVFVLVLCTECMSCHIPVYLRLWAVTGARWEPFCPARRELILLQLQSVLLSK